MTISLRKALLITAPLMIIMMTSVHAEDIDLDPATIAAPMATTNAPAPGERTVTFEAIDPPADDVPVGTTVHKGTDVATGSKKIEVTKTGEGKYRTVITSNNKAKAKQRRQSLKVND